MHAFLDAPAGALRALALIAPLALAGCGGGGSSQEPAAPEPAGASEAIVAPATVASPVTTPGSVETASTAGTSVPSEPATAESGTVVDTGTAVDTAPQVDSAPQFDTAGTVAPAVPVPSVPVPATPTSARIVAPATVMDLSGWKLNLPVDVHGGTGGTGGVRYAARTVLSGELVRGFLDDWFQADAEGRIVFTAPANGAVTTPGSGTDHTRSELRESNPRGDAKGDWTGSGTLAATCEVRQVATASYKAVIGQLKGENHVFAQVIYRPASSDVAVDVWASDTDGSGHAVTVLATRVALGQPIAYSLSFAGGRLTATANGASRTVTPTGDWSTVPLYFKVGAYHSAPNVGNPAGDNTVVACKGISVAH